MAQNLRWVTCSGSGKPSKVGPPERCDLEDIDLAGLLKEGPRTGKDKRDEAPGVPVRQRGEAREDRGLRGPSICDEHEGCLGQGLPGGERVEGLEVERGVRGDAAVYLVVDPETSLNNKVLSAEVSSLKTRFKGSAERATGGRGQRPTEAACVKELDRIFEAVFQTADVNIVHPDALKANKDTVTLVAKGLRPAVFAVASNLETYTFEQTYLHTIRLSSEGTREVIAMPASS